MSLKDVRHEQAKSKAAFYNALASGTALATIIVPILAYLLSNSWRAAAEPAAGGTQQFAWQQVGFIVMVFGLGSVLTVMFRVLANNALLDLYNDDAR